MLLIAIGVVLCVAIAMNVKLSMLLIEKSNTFHVRLSEFQDSLDKTEVACTHLEANVGVMSETVASYQNFLNELLDKIPSTNDEMVEIVTEDGSKVFVPEDREY